MGNRQGWDDWFKAAQLESQSGALRHSVDSAALSVTMAVNNFGVCLSYDKLVAAELKSGRLIAPFERYMDTVDSFYLTYPENQPLSKASSVFADWLLETLKVDS